MSEKSVLSGLLAIFNCGLRFFNGGTNILCFLVGMRLVLASRVRVSLNFIALLFTESPVFELSAFMCFAFAFDPVAVSNIRWFNKNRSLYFSSLDPVPSCSCNLFIGLNRFKGLISLKLPIWTWSLGLAVRTTLGCLGRSGLPREAIEKSKFCVGSFRILI